ncbi:hypothetical protein Micbo1qcDRAFT_181203 [Microdochium bolleyi]|uniref:Uncharacterized protein n=1 Tax=Microdochium bolleyi TaxID=196109 RepID=A0A136IJ28_9PEZI|nr:hypothetical protein Micbo1qcDRAFT_181203 [Microdochium bolleyi]
MRQFFVGAPRLWTSGPLDLWTTDNIHQEACSVHHCPVPKALPTEDGDHDTADGYLWAGKLAVYAKEMREAVDFQPTGDLSPDRTIHVHASNEPARTEFNYKYNDAKETTVTQKLAESCFNIIYDDMPLPGWWPWPEKYSNGAGTGDEYKSGNVGGGGSLI